MVGTRKRNKNTHPGQPAVPKPRKSREEAAAERAAKAAANKKKVDERADKIAANKKKVDERADKIATLA